jgi:hypothetical protein
MRRGTESASKRSIDFRGFASWTGHQKLYAQTLGSWGLYSTSTIGRVYVGPAVFIYELQRISIDRRSLPSDKQAVPSHPSVLPPSLPSLLLFLPDYNTLGE